MNSASTMKSPFLVINYFVRHMLRDTRNYISEALSSIKTEAILAKYHRYKQLSNQNEVLLISQMRRSVRGLQPLTQRN
jgi:hypothetical protein